MNNLHLKKDALKDLDLPIEVVFGYLGKLSLKMPWKNLYTEPVEAVIDELYLYAKPSKLVRYDAEKEVRRKIQEKKSKLKLLEEARQTKDAVDKMKVDKSFSEKLIMQIVNNIQIKVSNIHIRYEDQNSFSSPFMCGISLKHFNINTTDAKWTETFTKEVLSKTFKIANLVGLSVYFNCSADCFTDKQPDVLLEKFKSTISTDDYQPPDYNYILGPITSKAKLKLNSSPQVDNPPFEIPKIDLAIEMKKITLGITKDQYRNIIELTQSMDRSIKGAPYRKFRPYNLPIIGNAKLWWRFAYESVCETYIRKRRREWSWKYMSKVRRLCRKYERAYQTKRITRKPTPEMIKECDEIEEELDLFNLIRIQNMVEIVVAKMELEKPEKGGWFPSWIFGAKDDTKSNENTALSKF